MKRPSVTVKQSACFGCCCVEHISWLGLGHCCSYNSQVLTGMILKAASAFSQQQAS